MRAAAILLVAVALVLTGCAQNLADVVKAAGNDPATVCGSISTVYGVGKFARTNCTNCNVSCSQDGLTIRTDPVTVPVGIQVVPGGTK